VPTDADLNELLAYVGDGGALKETGFDHWSSPNTGATNSSGFTALGASYRSYINGLFATLKQSMYLWASNETVDENPYLAFLLYGSTSMTVTYGGVVGYKANGFSVRLVKDYPTSPVTVDSTLITCDSLAVTSDME
jgi:uncharacterized protein (TIGR02145 family)